MATGSKPNLSNYNNQLPSVFNPLDFSSNGLSQLLISEGVDATDANEESTQVINALDNTFVDLVSTQTISGTKNFTVVNVGNSLNVNGLQNDVGTSITGLNQILTGATYDTTYNYLNLNNNLHVYGQIQLNGLSTDLLSTINNIYSSYQPLFTSGSNLTVGNLTVSGTINSSSISNIANLQYLDISSSLTTQLTAKQNKIYTNSTLSFQNLTLSGTFNNASVANVGNLQYLDISSSLTTQLGTKQPNLTTSTPLLGQSINGTSLSNIGNLPYLDVSSSINSQITTINNNVSTNTTNIATNTSNIATNTSNIATNTTNITTNTTNIATNTTNIATNTANITTNTNNISSLQSSKQNLLNSTSSNSISCLSVSTPSISLNGSDLGTTLSQHTTNLSGITYDGTNTDISNNVNLNGGANVKNGVIVNSITQNGALFGSGLTLNYGSSNAIQYNMLPPYLPLYWSAGASFTGGASGSLPVMSNQTCYINWAIPYGIYGQSQDANMNCAIIEVNYFIQECPVNTSTTTKYPIFIPTPSSTSFLTTSISSTQSAVSPNLNINAPNYFTQQFYIAASISATTIGSTSTSVNASGSANYDVYVKYLNGVYSNTNSISSSTMYGQTFTPLQFYYVAFNKIKLLFTFPSSNNGTTVNTHGNGAYISSYGCSVRILCSDGSNGQASGNLYPYNGTSVPTNSLSPVGRAFLSTS